MAARLRVVADQLPDGIAATGLVVVPRGLRCSHILGLRVSVGLSPELMERLREAGVFASVRLGVLGLGPHAWTNEADVTRCVAALPAALRWVSAAPAARPLPTHVVAHQQCRTLASCRQSAREEWPLKDQISISGPFAHRSHQGEPADNGTGVSHGEPDSRRLRVRSQPVGPRLHAEGNHPYKKLQNRNGKLDLLPGPCRPATLSEDSMVNNSQQHSTARQGIASKSPCRGSGSTPITEHWLGTNSWNGAVSSSVFEKISWANLDTGSMCFVGWSATTADPANILKQ